MRTLSIQRDKWPLKKPFIIARGSRIETETLSVSITEEELTGSGECTPNIRYNESMDTVAEEIESVRAVVEQGLDRDELQGVLTAGAARNALDVALWDLEAKKAKQDIGVLSGLGWPKNISTVQTISIQSPEQMGKEASILKDFSTLKVKLNGERIVERIRAVHENAPKSVLLIDANESWTIDQLQNVAPVLAGLGVAMIEQPLREGQDAELAHYSGPLAIYADESCRVSQDLPRLKDIYDGVNIKLDKTGGLTEALLLLKKAKASDLSVMVGCMVSTSLGIAPALFLAQHAKFVDVDAPALLARDRDHAIQIDRGRIETMNPRLWGGG